MREGGDHEFADYFRASWSRLYRIALAVAGDARTAEDDLQNAMSKVYAHWGRVRSAENPDAYVRKVVLNEVLASRRRGFARRERVVEHSALDTAHPSAEAEVVQQRVVWATVQGLPPRQRAVVVLRYYEDLSEVEIAEALGCSRGTVKSQASAALAKLRLVAPEILWEDA